MLVIGGSPIMTEIHHDYQQSLINHTEHIRLTPLPDDDAWTLITNPSQEFDLNYEPEAVNRIISKTEGHPYLIQLLCRAVVNHLNHELCEENKKREIIITQADVETVMQTGLLEANQ